MHSRHMPRNESRRMALPLRRSWKRRCHGAVLRHWLHFTYCRQCNCSIKLTSHLPFKVRLSETRFSDIKMLIILLKTTNPTNFPSTFLISSKTARAHLRTRLFLSPWSLWASWSRIITLRSLPRSYLQIWPRSSWILGHSFRPIRWRC